MVAEVFSGIGALKAAFDMSKALADMSDAAKRDRLSINLQKEILAAQAAQSELAEEVRDLKAKLASFEKWDTEKERYKLNSLEGGGFAYVLKEDCASGEPPHWLCASCFDNKKKSILQDAGQAGASGIDLRIKIWRCWTCTTLVRTHLLTSPAWAK